MAGNAKLRQINFDWNEKSKVMHLAFDQDKLRVLGIDGQTLARTLQTQLSGASIAEYYEGDKTVAIMFRVQGESRQDLAKLKDMPIYLSNGKICTS